MEKPHLFLIFLFYFFSPLILWILIPVPPRWGGNVQPGMEPQFWDNQDKTRSCWRGSRERIWGLEHLPGLAVAVLELIIPEKHQICPSWSSQGSLWGKTGRRGGWERIPSIHKVSPRLSEMVPGTGRGAEMKTQRVHLIPGGWHSPATAGGSLWGHPNPTWSCPCVTCCG